MPIESELKKEEQIRRIQSLQPDALLTANCKQKNY